MTWKELLLRETEDMKEICAEIMSHGMVDMNMEIPKTVPKTSSEAAVCLLSMLKLYLKLIFQIVTLQPGELTTQTPEMYSSLSYTIWARVHCLVLNSIKKEAQVAVEESRRGTTSAGCQTNETSLRTCENCTFTKNVLLRRVVEEVEHVCSECNVNSDLVMLRQKLRPKLHYMTDWSTLNLMSEVIIGDLKKISFKQGSGSVKKTIRKGSRKMLLNVIQNLEFQLGYAPETAVGLELQKKNNEISELNEALSRYQTEVDELREKLETNEKLKKDMSEETFRLQLKLDDEKSSIKLVEERFARKISETTAMLNKYEKEISSANAKIVSMELENRSKGMLIDEQLISLQNLEKQLYVFREKEKTTSEQISDLMERVVLVNPLKKENDGLQLKLREKAAYEKKLIDRTKLLQKRLNAANEEIKKMNTTKGTENSNQISFTEETGVGIELEKTANEQKIKSLESKNKKLEVALNKIALSRRISGPRVTTEKPNEIIYCNNNKINFLDS